MTPDDCLRAIAIKGFAPIQGVADAVLSTPDDVQPILDQLVVDGPGRDRRGRLPADRRRARPEPASSSPPSSAAWGIDQAAAGARRVPRARPADEGRPSRPGSSATTRRHRSSTTTRTPPTTRAVLDRLAALHADASAWLDPARGRLPPARAATASGSTGRSRRPAAGDQRYVASPRVDSYHGIWFELHEDLIQLAGRTREDEIAAGRA